MKSEGPCTHFSSLLGLCSFRYLRVPISGDAEPERFLEGSTIPGMAHVFRQKCFKWAFTMQESDFGIIFKIKRSLFVGLIFHKLRIIVAVYNFDVSWKPKASFLCAWLREAGCGLQKSKVNGELATDLKEYSHRIFMGDDHPPLTWFTLTFKTYSKRFSSFSQKFL